MNFLNSKDKIKNKVIELAKEDSSPREIAFGLAVGGFIAVSPFYGFQTISAIIVSYLFNINKPATVGASLIAVPWIYPLFLFIDYSIGNFILYSSSNFALQNISWQSIMPLFQELVVGSVIFGILLGTVIYFTSLKVIERYGAKNAQPDRV